MKKVRVNSSLFYIKLLFLFTLVQLWMPAANSQPLYNVTLDHMLRLYKIKCLDLVTVDAESILRLANGWEWRKNIQKIPIGLKKWIHCIIMNIGIMTPEGVFKMDDALELVLDDNHRSYVEKKVDKCLPKKRTNLQPYDIAWFYAACYNIKNPRGFTLL